MVKDVGALGEFAGEGVLENAAALDPDRSCPWSALSSAGRDVRPGCSMLQSIWWCSKKSSLLATVRSLRT